MGETHEQRLQFFDEVMEVVRQRWSEAQQDQPTVESLRTMAGLTGTAIAALAVVLGRDAVWHPTAVRNFVLPPDRCKVIERVFIQKLPLKCGLAGDRREIMFRLYTTLHICLLASALLPPSDLGNKKMGDKAPGWVSAIHKEIVALMHSKDFMSLLHEPCAPNPCLPTASMLCVDLVLVIAERLLFSLTDIKRLNSLSEVLLRVFNNSDTSSPVKRQCLSFLRSFTASRVTRPQDLRHPLLRPWVSALPLLLRSLKGMDEHDMAKDILFVFRHVLIHLHPEDEHQEKWSGLHQNILKAVFGTGQDNKGYFHEAAPDLKVACIELLYYFCGSRAPNANIVAKAVEGHDNLPNPKHTHHHPRHHTKQCRAHDTDTHMHAHTTKPQNQRRPGLPS
eukprot:NODE_761_length_1466_cov_79.683839_g626_i0.p1 GENE.NODE_761_length_1466_cov_79.683839_g626_i0~~NODE_761_length_1466_cov_79.683839_g626_i0.p1  ORF type:complete len:401 (-),score=92.83 NODE_761_length_1466_cov_79.683839_g626_i0:264-1439(-)